MSLRRSHLPALRAPYDSNHEYTTTITPRYNQEVVTVPFTTDIPVRVENLEDRINNQERNTQVG